MSLPGLKTTIELEREPVLRLVDRANGVSLTLSETEALVLEKWNGTGTATDLSAHVFVEGLDVEPWQVEQFFDRLVKSGLLATTAPVVPDFVPARPGIEQPEDIVPRLRGDLRIANSEKSRGTREVTDPLTERTFTLYDFEVSIARMLDGKRSAAEVLAAANRLGIPVNLATLRTFLQQLKAYKFIDDSAPGGDSTWPPRAQWTAEVRELYQSALRLMRQGKYDEALGYADAMQAADPSNGEATGLRARIEAEAKGSLELRVDFETLHTPLSTDAVETSPGVVAEIVGPPGAADPFASFGFNAQPPSASALPAIPDELGAAPRSKPKAAAVSEDDDLALTPPPRSKRRLIIGALGVLLLAGVLLRPVETRRELPCELQVQVLGVPKAPRACTVQPTDVKPGDVVEKGALLARITPLEEPGAPEVDAKLTELDAKLAALTEAKGPKVVKARAALKKAQAVVDALEKQKRKAPKKQQATIEKKLKPKLAGLDIAKGALEVLTHAEARAALTAERAKWLAQKPTAAVGELTIVAPATGVFVGVLTSQLTEGEAWGQIVAPDFTLVTAPVDRSIEAATFRYPGGTAEVKFEQGAARLKVTAPLVGAKGTLEIAGGRTPWVLTLF